MAADPIRVLVTRPEPGASQTAHQLAARGFQPVKIPLFRIVPDSDLTTMLTEAQTLKPQAIAFTSANGARILSQPGPVPEHLLQCPVYAVGAATAEAAKIAGFVTILVTPPEYGSDAAGLAAFLADQCHGEYGPILHLHGAHRAADLASLLTDADLRVVSRSTYRSLRDETFQSALHETMDQAPVDAVLHYSPRAARHYIERAAGIDIPDHVCLSQSVADALHQAMKKTGTSARAVILAEMPAEPALLEALERTSLTQRQSP